jgi:hypothetical protein
MFVRRSDKDSKSLILWTPAMNSDSQIAFESLEALQKMYPEFSPHSQYFADDVPLFKSFELGNYQLLQTFPGYKIASPLPAEISKLLGFLNKDIRFIGAYPPLP